MIHAQALVEEGAQLGNSVSVAAMAIIKAGAIVAEGVSVDHFAVVGGLPQDIHFNPQTQSYARIGKNCVLREGVTVHRSTKEGQSTIVGDDCFLMANSHVAHDCVLANRVILANGVLLAGHVHVGEGCFIGGNAVVHQFVNIGRGSIIGGGVRVAADLPPYCIATSFNEVAGLNLIGMKRSGMSAEEVSELRLAYRAVYFHPGSLQKKAATALEQGIGKTDPARHFLEVIVAGSQRGFCRSPSERGNKSTAQEQ